MPLWTGFGQAAIVLPVRGPAVLVVDQPDWRTDLVECDEVIVRRDVYSGVVETLKRSGLTHSRIGLTDEERMTVAAFRQLQRELEHVTLERADELLMRRRMIKSPAELDCMRHASAVGGEIMSAMFAQVAEGRTDADVVAAGFSIAAQLGAQPYDFAMASGPEDGHLWWSRLPSWNWERPYEWGDIVHPDIYGAVDGYFYDFVRSIVVGGEPTPAQVEILEAGIGCIHAACAAARPGSPAKAVYEAGRRYLREQGFDHVDEPGVGVVDLSTEALESIGHGLGLGWEEPWLTPLSETVLEPGMVLAVEQHVSRRGVGTMRYEETIIVTDGEPEIMTAGCPARWW
jgi:Xaa-Pro aminopeptidase